MKISLNDLRDFSYCPAYYNFNKKSPVIWKPDNRKLVILQDVIKKAYLRVMQDKRKADWKMLLGWVDKAVFADVDIDNDQQFERARTLAESILGSLKQWYEKIYSIELPAEGYADLELQTQMGQVVLECGVPLLKVTDPPTLVIVSSTVVNRLDLYNNVEYRALIWALCRELDVDDLVLEYLCFNDSNGGFKATHLESNRKMLARTEDVIKQIGVSIKLGINYTSRSVECASCPFQKDCVL